MKSPNLNPLFAVDVFFDSSDCDFDSKFSSFSVFSSALPSFELLVFVSLVLMTGLLVPKLNTCPLLGLLLIGFIKLVDFVSVSTELFLTSSESFMRFTVFSNDDI